MTQILFRDRIDPSSDHPYKKQRGIKYMKKLFKTNEIRYNSLQGKTVAVRTLKKINKKNQWDTVEYERSYDIVHVEEIGYSTFVDTENNEYSIGDIIKVF